jgi:hypothetical protein
MPASMRRANPGRADRAGETTMHRYLFILLILLPWYGSASGAPADDVDELVSLLLIREDLENQHRSCVESSASIVEAEIRHEIDNDFADLELDADDIALLISIYSEFYQSGCDYLDGDEVIDFYRGEIRKRFSAEEIRALIDFYRSPLGRKLNAEWLQINRLYDDILSERQAADSFAAQRRYEEQMELFWFRLENKAAEEAPDRGA